MKKKDTVPTGYKLSPFGLIPKTWSWCQLKHIVDPERTIRYGIVQPGVYDPNGRFMVRGQDYSFGWVSPEMLFRVSDEIERGYKNARLKAGDLIITIVGAGTGTTAIVPPWLDGANLTQTTARIAIHNKHAFAPFCYYFLSSSHGARLTHQNVKGGAQPGLNCGDIEKYAILLPPIAEQRKIALILSTWDRAIEKTEQLIDQKQQLKKGLMQQLLTGKVRFKEFVKSKKVAKTKLRLIPEDWSEARLGNCVTKVGSGVTPSGGEAVYKSTGRVFVRSQNIGHGKLLLEDVAFIDEDTHQSFPLTEIFEFDILLNITGASIGRCAVADSRVVGGNVNQHVCIIRVNQTLDPHFLAAYLLSEFGQNQIDSFQAGGNRQGLNFEQIKSFRVPLPSIREQRRISAVMRDADREIEQLIGTQNKLQSQKRALMQRLLTGKVRVKH